MGLLLACGAFGVARMALSGDPPRAPSTAAVPSFAADVEPVLERRCVVCHACYDAPCQLVMTAWEGVERGAATSPVYDSSRPLPARPTRLFVDARNVEGWRQLGFFPVLGGGDVRPEAGLLARMLALGRAAGFTPDQRLPSDVELDITRKLHCPTEAGFEEYARSQPHGGMPYGMAPLPDRDLAVLQAWLAAGAPPPPPAPPAETPLEVQRWEAFLNHGSLKEQIVARYLYEHWFLADLEMADIPGRPYYRIVRSSTAPGEPAVEIATRRPTDPPGVSPFYYRLLPSEQVRVQKTHIVYRLDHARIERLRELFLDSDWTPDRLPSYEPDEASNPFVAFDQIPARSRYQFLLDDARFFVMSFIHGPVCRGQVAVNVIREHFFVAFLDPDADLSVSDPRFLQKAKELLRLPAENESHLALGGLWLDYNRSQREYMDLLKKRYDEADPERLGPSLNAIWDGDGTNGDAYLTVFRNYDNAMVLNGFLGDIPETAWVMDFPIFERIYYNLVVGFDVYGNITHQIATRLYMDHLRMQSEDLFLLFLPRDVREKIRSSWYRGAGLQVSYFLTNSIRGFDHGTRVTYTSDDPKSELLWKLIDRNRGLARAPDVMNRCGQPPCVRTDAHPVEREVEDALRRIAARTGEFVPPLPEISLLRVRTGPGRPDLVYTLVHNKILMNVAFMFLENLRRLPEEDTLTVLRGFGGSYPNFVFEVDAPRIGAFVEDVRAVKREDDLHGLADRWGVRRTSPRFWQVVDALQAELSRQQPERAGILDLNRYENL